MDELSRRIRAANPYPVGRLPANAEKLLTSLLTQPAVTPDPLRLLPAPETTGTLREEIRMGAEKSGTASRLGSEHEGWCFQPAGDRAGLGFIQPQHVRSEARADGSGITRVYAGDAYSPAGSPLLSLPAGAECPGSLIAETRWSAGEFGAAFPSAPPNRVAEMRKYLERYLGRENGSDRARFSACDYACALTALLQTWTLSASAQRALVRVLIDAPGIRVAGSTADRIGRGGVALDFDPAGPQGPGYRDRLVIDTARWRILASESMTLDGIPEHGLPPGAVTSYTLWR